ncbi:MAG: hypothetical protein KF729_29580 [Sandaracinaceae bacterium]|nr:hypothetical protein [Sandaracinaceae bacterium]
MAYALLASIALLAACEGPAAPHAEVGHDTAGALFAGHDPVRALAPAMIRARDAAAITAGIGAAQSPFDAPSIPESLRLNLFGDAVLDAHVEGASQHDGTLLWRGAIAGRPESHVTLAIRDGAIAGTVRDGDSLFTIVPRADGVRIVEWDEAAAPGDAPSVFPPASALAAPPGAPPATPAERADGVAEIDVLVLATAAARDGAGSRAALRATIDLAFEEANASFADSGVAARVNVVGVVETSYDERGFDFHDALGRLVTPGDGWMDEVHALREELGADHVVLIVNHAGPYAGLGYQLTAENRAYFSHYAYSVVSRDYAAGFYTLAHELGHNMGADHDRDNAGGGFHAHSHGHRAQAAGYRTMMAYACDGAACPRARRWSDPTRTHRGVPTGVDGVSDNARTLRGTTPLAAAFRARPMRREPVAARVSAPATGSALPAGTVRFAWDDVGADEHFLFVGHLPSAGTWYARSVGAATSADVPGLPDDGRPVHVRVWSRFGATYLASDATFTAHRAAPRARLSFPGATLPGAWGFFAWDAILGATRYRLEVGTAAEPTRYGASEGSRTFELVVGLPVDASEVVARLSTYGEEGWSAPAISTHRASSAPAYAAPIVTPPHGSQLSSPRMALRWAHRGADRYWVVVSDASGVVASVPASGDRITLTDLPDDGRALWVALYAHGDAGWAATSAAYTAHHR